MSEGGCLEDRHTSIILAEAFRKKSSLNIYIHIQPKQNFTHLASSTFLIINSSLSSTLSRVLPPTAPQVWFVDPAVINVKKFNWQNLAIRWYEPTLSCPRRRTRNSPGADISPSQSFGLWMVVIHVGKTCDRPDRRGRYLLHYGTSVTAEGVKSRGVRDWCSCLVLHNGCFRTRAAILIMPVRWRILDGCVGKILYVG
jgi:hypothetical protein